ncbi:TPA: hypothetical protein ACNABU_002946 [Citrobacter amalonaticus]
METVIDVLKAMSKATYREVAARLEIEPVEALNMLREQREQGLCDFFDGGWEVTGNAGGKTSIRSAPAKTVLRAKNINDTPKKCRCQVFRANQEGLETVYGTVG